MSCSNGNLLSVEVCLDPSNRANPTAISCPANRTAAVGPQAGAVECAGSAWMRLGIEVSGAADAGPGMLRSGVLPALGSQSQGQG